MTFSKKTLFKMTDQVIELSDYASLKQTTAVESRLNRKISSTESQAVAFGTEAPFYNQIGLETTVMGPGGIKQAHQPDEFIEMKT